MSEESQSGRSSESPRPTALSESRLNALKEGGIAFHGNRTTTYTAYADLSEESEERVLIGSSSYSFYENSITTGETLKDVSYYKASDGKAIAYETDFRNVMNEVAIEGGNLAFDSAFYNPFKDLSLSDFSLNDDGSYSLSESKRDSFFKPISFYSETLLGLSFVPYEGSYMEMSFKAKDKEGNYVAIVTGALSSWAEGDLEVPSPYETESYHSTLQAAYDELVEANNLTYERSRKPVDDDIGVEEESYTSYISKSDPCAVVFAYNGEDTSGIARYDDGEDYTFTAEDGKAIKGDSSSIKLPFTVGTVKAEVFEKVDETHYAARTSGIAKSVCGFLMEKLGDALLVDGSAFGDEGCESLTLEMKDGKLTGFEYTVTRSSEDNSFYLELNTVEIVDVGTTIIPYEFKTGEKKEDPKFDITPFVGEYEGYNVASASDDGLHSVSIEDLDNMALDGKKLAFKSRVHDESFNAVYDDTHYVQVSISSRYGLTIREADGEGSSQFIRGYFLNLAKKGSNVPSLEDISFSNGWHFEDYDENEFKIKMSTTIEDSKFYVQERIDGSWQDVEKEMSEISYEAESATLTFKANGDSFTMRFFSNEQGIVKSESGEIKAVMSPASDY